MKSFNVPEFYRSPVISKVKQFRKIQDPRKKDNSPAVLDFGPVQYFVARHFGFCYGVENAIEIAFRAIEENPGRRIFLLSEMIHNPEVNADLQQRGVRFLHDTHGKELHPVSDLKSVDVVIIPAFGAPLELLDRVREKSIEVKLYDTTCPFVERVWKKSEQIGKGGHTIIIHGKYTHEETRSTFSRSERDSGAVVVVRDMEETRALTKYIRGEGTQQEFERAFAGKFSGGFDISRHFDRVGVINQTTMLATETQAIADFIREEMRAKFGDDSHFADTRDTLCYATNENQEATYGLLKTNADLAIVVGGYNSSNTSHLVELCEKKFPTYFISSEREIESRDVINHFDYPSKSMRKTRNFLPRNSPLKIVLTSGASCPDSTLDRVIARINSFFPGCASPEEVVRNLRTYSETPYADQAP
jgi:4-hydroxy-3-methylbut-2-en-1-yl diphosphate reductase